MWRDKSGRGTLEVMVGDPSLSIDHRGWSLQVGEGARGAWMLRKPKDGVNILAGGS